MRKTITALALLTATVTAGAQGFTLQKTNDKEAQALKSAKQTENLPEHLKPGSADGLNEIYYMYIGDIKNLTEKVTTKDALANVLTTVLTKKVYTDHPSRFADVEACIRKSLNCSPRIIMKDFADEGEFRQFAAQADRRCILVTGAITGLRTKMEVKDKDNSKGYYGYVEGNITLTDNLQRGDSHPHDQHVRLVVGNVRLAGERPDRCHKRRDRQSDEIYQGGIHRKRTHT